MYVLIQLLNRLKKVQGKKKRDAVTAEAKKNAELSAADDITPASPHPVFVTEDIGGGDLLSSKDEDVIF